MDEKAQLPCTDDGDDVVFSRELLITEINSAEGVEILLASLV